MDPGYLLREFRDDGATFKFRDDGAAFKFRDDGATFKQRLRCHFETPVAELL